MNLSYWEYKSWFSNIDYTVVGSGIVGLTTAIRLRQKYPKASILVLEKGVLPQGASTKNAGFACFGSISEILADLKEHSEEELVRLVDQRWRGIQSLRGLLGDTNIGYQNNGGHEIFLEKDEDRFQYCYDNISDINELLSPVFQKEPFKISNNKFGFEGVNQHYITHIFEGQIDTGRMMKSLLEKAMKADINIINSTPVESFEDTGSIVDVKCNGIQFKTHKLFVATNGFAQQLFKENVRPARAQVIITKPIKNLHIKGTFHLEEGYYYFRNIDDRILLGGGRNLDFKTEETFEFGQTSLVQHKLKELLSTLILPTIPFEIDYGWSGIMGVGPQKKPIIKRLSNNVACGVRLGGMGVAIGASVGEKLADIF